jgi:hypothetical protein
MTEMVEGEVECYSGHTYPQEPTAVIWHDRRYSVAAVSVRWRTPEGPAFWIETETGERFELRYDESTDTWMIRPLLEDDRPSPQEVTSSSEVRNDDKEGPTQ